MSYYNIHLKRSAHFPMNTMSKILVMKMADSMLTKIPMASVSANPLMNDVVKINKMAHTNNELKLLSRMDGQARENPSLIALEIGDPFFISSFILAKIKILASTAIPMDKIKPPMPASVSVTGTNLN